MKNKPLLLTIIILIISMSSLAQVTATFNDARDSTIYKTVQIETQTWMAENLNYNANESWCYKDDTCKCNIYGRLYTWDAAKTACPVGWHLPSNDEWTILINNLGGEKIAGGKMKESGTTHWKSPNKGAINTSGFTALPSGDRHILQTNSLFLSIGYYNGWWSSTESNSSYAWSLGLSLYSTNVNTGDCAKRDGLSIRCLKD
ncbi:MAG: hypothetical protein HGB12_15440 [Bacteroidetes bacterium]|nr:hypothetical protein [Bacteroidota bacterium]